jgi:hypothetical protein
MSDQALSDRYEARYKNAVGHFASEIEGLDASGIPEPHIPHWGSLYESASLKIGIVGRDTRSWGDMPAFMDAVKNDPREALFRGKEDFDSLVFTGWTNNFGTTFWDTAIKILAALHGVSDWKRLKLQEITEPLKSFFWANVNSVERFEVSPRANKVPWDTWYKVKKASEHHLDSFRALLDIFQPHVVFLLNWDPGEHFLDFPLTWDEFGNHQAEARDSVTGCLILATAHPTWLNQNRLYDQAISGLIKRANTAMHRMP